MKTSNGITQSENSLLLDPERPSLALPQVETFVVLDRAALVSEIGES
jgi:hypothetical protein